MSWVANVMLSVGLEDRLNAEAFSGWLDKECPRREPGMGPGGCGNLSLITDADNQWGGHKNPECQVYAGALNHADLAAVVDHLGSLAWHDPNAVQLFTMDQEEFFFRVWMIRRGAVRQYAPASPDEEGDEFWHTAGS
ncbi:squamosa promoter-binding protein 15 [Micromonospora sp. NPDC049580]|uniref:squamosa promoter-binding protein 15 n=1 Tax=Micromonospora sp. NPDC049580 TaxID=3154832 RepID=UPI00343B692F